MWPSPVPQYYSLSDCGRGRALLSRDQFARGECSTVRQSWRLVTGVGVAMLIIFSIVGLSHELADEDIGNVSTIPLLPQPEVELSAACANPYQQ